ncbi:hypothetical protein AD428_03065 [Achromobacter sp. DMS1]|nr:hypothetical protein AD428_06260 [Achromobacter sp. DMS1]KOF55063.1 hypothetical protein AD428_03065 [Achromobacter sp. DMS1]
MVHAMRGASQPLLKRLAVFTQIVQPSLDLSQLRRAKSPGEPSGQGAHAFQVIGQRLPIGP